jgi:hypothetical protein
MSRRKRKASACTEQWLNVTDITWSRARPRAGLFFRGISMTKPQQLDIFFRTARERLRARRGRRHRHSTRLASRRSSTAPA